MERPGKRLKLDQGRVIDAATGRVVSILELLTTHRDVFFSTMLPELSYKDVAAMELASPKDQALIHARVWPKLYKRDYPAQEKYIRENWDEMTKVLDVMSKQPGRKNTYWKRFYELQVSERPTAGCRFVYTLTLPSGIEEVAFQRFHINYISNKVHVYFKNLDTMELFEARIQIDYTVLEVSLMRQIERKTTLSALGTDGFKTPFYLGGKHRTSNPFIVISVSADEDIDGTVFISVHTYVRRPMTELVSSKICGECGAEATHVCAGCKTAPYCSDSCATKAWRGGHRSECNVYKK